MLSLIWIYEFHVTTWNYISKTKTQRFLREITLKKCSKTSKMCHLECLKDTNYVVVDMDLRISCEFQTFIDTSTMLGVYLVYFEFRVVMLSLIWIYKFHVNSKPLLILLQ